MSLSAEEVWSRLLDRARIELSEQVIATWLVPLSPDSVDEQTLTVTAPDQWSVEWNEQKHGAILDRGLFERFDVIRCSAGPISESNGGMASTRTGVSPRSSDNVLAMAGSLTETSSSKTECPVIVRASCVAISLWPSMFG